MPFPTVYTRAMCDTTARASRDRFAFRPSWAALALVAASCFLRAFPCGADLESDLGRTAARYVEAQYGLCASPPLARWVRDTGAALVAPQSGPSARARFAVLNSGEINAFTLPGGYIYCDAGLLGHVDSEDDLAGVLAHEVAHVADRDFQRLALRQTLLFALTGVLTNGGNSRATPALRVAQMLDALRQSRRVEGQADDVGLAICLRSGYDPAGLQNFLAQIAAGQARWSYWTTLLSTHPEAAKRQAHVAARLAESFSTAERIQLAESLIRRTRYHQALYHLQEARRQSPGLPTIPLHLASLYLLEGRRAEALAQCQEALRLEPDSAEARELLGQLEAQVSEAPPVHEWKPSLDLRSKLDEQMGVLAGAEEQRRQLREAITTETRRLRANGEFNRALEVAQVVGPDEGALGYWALLAEAARVLSDISRLSDQVMEMRWIEYDLPQVLFDESDSLLRPQAAVGSVEEMAAAADHLLSAAHLAGATHTAALERMARAAGSCRRLAGQVTPVLVELMATGDDRPLGRLIFSRAALFQTQLSLAQAGLRRAETDADGALRDLCALKVACYRASLACLGAQASQSQDLIYRRVLAQLAARPVVDPQTPREVDLGLTAQALLLPEAQPAPPSEKEKPTTVRKGPWDEEAYAAYVLMRLAYKRCEEETLPSP